jgi:hypothetical protein
MRGIAAEGYLVLSVSLNSVTRSSSLFIARLMLCRWAICQAKIFIWPTPWAPQMKSAA